MQRKNFNAHKWNTYSHTAEISQESNSTNYSRILITSTTDQISVWLILSIWTLKIIENHDELVLPRKT